MSAAPTEFPTRDAILAMIQPAHWTTYDAAWNVTGCWLDRFDWRTEMRKLAGEFMTHRRGVAR